jgi:2,3-bisphosphoglycerate-dependent phosphoglycerate mutase
MPYLTLVRHGESQFNAKSLWTGLWDVPLTHKGRHQAVLMAKVLKDSPPDTAYTSMLSRAHETLDIILTTNHWDKVTVQADPALNERDYGDLTGMNKWAVEATYGKAQFQKWRRGWDEQVPNGETLKTVYRRVIPYFDTHIMDDLKHDKDVIVAAHGNSLRTIIMHLDQLTPQQVTHLEMPFGVVIVYTFDEHGVLQAKDIRKFQTTPTPA